MPTLPRIVVHEQLTRKSRYQYQFTPKHHGADVRAAQWLPTLSLEEEFAVFDVADFHDIFDEGGRYYGVLPDANGKLRDLGTWKQEMAEFPRPNEGVPWHGYPVYAVNELAPGNRSGQKGRPVKEVFAKLEQVGLLTPQQRKRLYKGDHAS
jgi:hypothetical protein